MVDELGQRWYVPERRKRAVEAGRGGSQGEAKKGGPALRLVCPECLPRCEVRVASDLRQLAQLLGQQQAKETASVPDALPPASTAVGAK